jgi:hypothetical protein
MRSASEAQPAAIARRRACGPRPSLHRLQRDQAGLQPAAGPAGGQTSHPPYSLAPSDPIKELSQPYPVDGITMWSVCKRVGNVKNSDPSLIEATTSFVASQ